MFINMNSKTFGYFKDVLENASSSNTLVICDTKSSFINNNNLKGRGTPAELKFGFKGDEGRG